jgi:flagellar hook-length control protein FliK
MRLEPPELGTVRIHLTATDHTITARFMVANESVRHIVTSQLDSLRQSLADAGMSLQRFDISHGGQGGTHGQAQQDLWRGTTLREHSWSVRHVAAPQVTSGAVPKGRIDVIV